MTLSEYITDRKITLQRGRLRYGIRSMAVDAGAGTVAEALAPMANEARNCIARFNDWCEATGRDADSLSAWHYYRTVQRQTVRLRRFLGGSEGLRELLECER